MSRSKAWEQSVGHTIERLDTGKVQLPAQMLAVDLAEIGDKKCVLITWLAEFVIDTLHATAEGITDQFFGCRRNGLADASREDWLNVISVIVAVVFFVMMLIEAIAVAALHEDMIIGIIYVV